MIKSALSIIKPDAVERNLSEKIKLIFSKNDLSILDSKKLHISRMKLRILQSSPIKTIFDKLCNYLSSGPIEVIILGGDNAVQKIEN